MNKDRIKKLIKALPKVELQVHIEGTLEPELMLMMAERNHIDIGYKNPEELRAAYQFKDLQSFLNLYYAGATVLQTEQDFFELTWAYLQKAHQQNVRHTELFFDPQTHTSHGVDLKIVINGIDRALKIVFLPVFAHLNENNNYFLSWMRLLVAFVHKFIKHTPGSEHKMDCLFLKDG